MPPSPEPQCELQITTVPNAPRNAIVGRLGNAWKIRIHAPPEDGRANKALTHFLAAQLALPRHAITLATGASSRQKRIRITGLTQAQAEQRLQQFAACTNTPPP
ncbi:MAG: DUF167 domain-containing protein [Puniceicoccales bacterium]|jgi:uncharacterized protein (TIGR00251 family)|nr:DUF167 domain-containing protein [Puniceicoccales bacterium]